MSQTQRVVLAEGQTLRVGHAVQVCVTDIDNAGVRIVADGQYLGGPEDGATFHVARELAIGSRAEFGPRVAMVLLRVEQHRSTFILEAPPHLAPVVSK
jgi:hypothetical protein